ncbi:MAG TPA: UvrD-helicase domain-containing protein [Egibacteraceae bacterium]
MEPFTLDAPLPRQATVLEASAGTGKTYTIEGLVARYVAEGTPLSQILAVTFTRAATAELRDRVRRRLVAVADHLDRVTAGAAPDDSADAVARLLAAGPLEVVAERRDRLTAALADYDAATITTIHGFCQQVLAGVGLSGDVDRAAGFVEDDRDVVAAVVDDLLVAGYHRAADGLPVSRATLLEIAHAVVGNPGTAIVPTDPDDPVARARVEFAKTVREQVERRKRAEGRLSYDDLLTRLAGTLRDPVQGPAALRRLRSQYRVVLIDEFQDTDPVQWDILRRVFVAGGGPTVLIGDPKQAIYAFRGADVHAYLMAVHHTSDQHTLETNYRSDAGLLTAYNRLFDGARLGHDEIAYRPVRASDANAEPRLQGAPVSAPLRLRVVRRDGGITMASRGKLQADAARDAVAADLAADVVRLLRSGATLLERGPDGVARRREVCPGDLAVLVRRNVDAALVQRCLADADVPAVINGVGSVFATPAATEWLRLLEALERPAMASRVRTVALTAFVGWTAEDVVFADDAAWEDLRRRLHRWAGVLRDSSVAALLRTVVAEQRLPERLLARRDGERLLTDITHIGELLHAAAVAEELGPTALSGWLRARIAEAGDDTERDERARRLESDAEAVQVLTIHRSKGLEFPIVYAPFLWQSLGSWSDVPVFHVDGRRCVDVGGKEGGPAFQEHKKDATAEQRGEELRLLYVALTRAKHQAVVWWAPAGYADRSPLGRVLFCRRADGSVNTRCTEAGIPDDDTSLERLQAIADGADGTISVETVALPVPRERWQPAPPPAHDLDTARFTRTLDERWRRTSYSALTRPAHGPLVGSESTEAVKDDEDLGTSVEAQPGLPRQPALDEAALRALVVPLADMPGGTEVGTFVHAVLEEVDFAADDLRAEVAAAVEAQARRRRTDVGDHDVLVDGLVKALQTPLGPIAEDRPLRAFSRRERLDELAFELPLVGGARPSAEITVQAIAELLADELPAGDPLAGYAERLADPALRSSLRGYLTGSIDAVLRLPDDRYAIVDYKTNHLGLADDGELSAWHYRPEALADAMVAGHYPLQALLYGVALHRYLRWRVRDYDPEHHLAGILYLFVRGMVGPDTPRLEGGPCGVFGWRPPAGLVPALSDLLARGDRSAR